MDGQAMIAIIAALVASSGLAACANSMTGETGAAAPTSGGATALIRDSAGAPKGRATVRPMGDGVHVDASLENMPAGVYAVHIHMVGRCDPPDFASAGSHWNPLGREHGRDNPAGPHKGDLPNLMVGADGRGSISAHVTGVTMSEANPLFDSDGAAILVHANGDDDRSQPSGNAGARIACGVLARS